MKDSADVLIIGAGVAGLAAACDISSAGLSVCVIEARERIGGRIYTRRDERNPLPVELGAEFIHGRPPETFEVARAARLLLCDVSEHFWYVRDGVLSKSDKFWSQIEEIMDKMKKAGRRDKSFREFLKSYGGGRGMREAREMAASYVEGFDAAHTERIGILGLNKEHEAEDEIDGDKQFRLLDGYDRVAQWLHDEALSRGATFHLGTIAQEIRWQRNHIELVTTSEDGTQIFSAPCLVVTLPLGVLQAGKSETGAVRFSPPLPDKERAARRLATGHVVRITLRFRERFWDDLRLKTKKGDGDLSELGFIQAPGEAIPTWWTHLPVRTPVLVGWAGGPVAEKLLSCDNRRLLDRALTSLEHIFGVPQEQLENLLEESYMHDWQADPFARGSYSYVPVDALDAQAELALQVEETIFFAGEATNTEGHSATVHGAIATGMRAAREIIESRMHGASGQD
jgi:monoamine oxidase